MEIRLGSLVAGATKAVGTVVIIDVFRAFTTAAVAFAAGARRIVMVGDLDEALALRKARIGRRCIGERGGKRPAGFDFGNSPAALRGAELTDETLIQTTSNGTAGIVAAGRAEHIYTGAFVNAAATASAIRRGAPDIISLIAIGRGKVRADEDELCALYLRSLLVGRRPDAAAMRRLLVTMPPPIDPVLVAAGNYTLRDREIAAEIDSIALAIEIRRDNGLLVAEPERIQLASPSPPGGRRGPE